MLRRHCHSARRESRPSNCALSNNERLPTARTLPFVDICSCVPSSSRIAAHCQLAWEECTLPMLSGEHMSGLRLGSQLSLCPGGTYTLPAGRACDRFANCTRYAQYFAFSPPTCFGSPAQQRSTTLPYCPRSCSVSQEVFSRSFSW